MTPDLPIIRRVIVLGGGSAGFMAALSLKAKMPDLPVTVIRSPDIKIIGVGESSTVNLPDFLHSHLRVDPKAFFDMVRPIWKMGIKFLWGRRPYFFYPFDAPVQLTRLRPELPKPPTFYCDQDMTGADPMSAMMEYKRVFTRKADGNIQFHNTFAYHLDNERYVGFLETFARQIGINIIEDTVAEVKQNDAGITGLALKSGRTEAADLYVDCSGFQSLLLGKTLGEPYISFRSTLFCSRAIIGTWPRMPGEPIDPYTTCETMNAGWCWRIDHDHRIDRGYVYCPEFISDDEAEREFCDKNPRSGPTRIVKFVSGRYERNFVKNVVAIGNSNGFVEPLESTALGMIGVQSRLLADSLWTSERQIRNTHRNLINRQHALMWDSIRAFLAIHYKFNDRLDTPFWRECLTNTNMVGAEEPIEYYSENGPDGFLGPMVVGPYDPFMIGGWVNLLLGQRVPYRNRHIPSEAEKRAFMAMRERHFQLARAALATEEVLAMVRSADWRW